MYPGPFSPFYFYFLLTLPQNSVISPLDFSEIFTIMKEKNVGEERKGEEVRQTSSFLGVERRKPANMLGKVHKKIKNQQISRQSP